MTSEGNYSPTPLAERRRKNDIVIEVLKKARECMNCTMPLPMDYPENNQEAFHQAMKAHLSLVWKLDAILKEYQQRARFYAAER